MIYGSSQVAFFQRDGMYVYHNTTATQVSYYPITLWGYSALHFTSQGVSGWSQSQFGLLVFRNVGSGIGPGAILFLPQFGKYDSNPAHIIYECLTNTSWGACVSPLNIDYDAFLDCAEVLYDERFGISMIWTQQSTIEAFINEVLDHIEATLFVNPFTGLLTLKLIRNDYVFAELPVFTPDNSRVTNFQRKLWGETVNEVVVSWTNPDNEEIETVIAQDDANIETQGGIVSDGRNYYGVRRKDLRRSWRIATCGRHRRRWRRATSRSTAPAGTCCPAACWCSTRRTDGIDQIVMRVGPVDYGKPGDPTVKAQLTEDVFALALATYTEPPATAWLPTAEAPSSADFTEILTLPYFVMVNVLSATQLSGLEYPEVFAGVLAAEDGQDTSEFDLYGTIVDAGAARRQAASAPRRSPAMRPCRMRSTPK